MYDSELRDLVLKFVQTGLKFSYPFFQIGISLAGFRVYNFSQPVEDINFGFGLFNFLDLDLFWLGLNSLDRRDYFNGFVFLTSCPGRNQSAGRPPFLEFFSCQHWYSLVFLL
jgi:hypothetical protein